MLEAGAVDVLQADATRCAGITGFLRVSPLVESRSMALSAHCAPSLHVHPCTSIPARPSLLRHRQRVAHRVLPRRRAHRAHALRRRADVGGRKIAARSLAAGPGHRAEACGRRAIRCVTVCMPVGHLPECGKVSDGASAVDSSSTGNPTSGVPSPGTRSIVSSRITRRIDPTKRRGSNNIPITSTRIDSSHDAHPRAVERNVTILGRRSRCRAAGRTQRSEWSTR